MKRDRRGFVLYEGEWIPAILRSNGGWELADNNFKPHATYLSEWDDDCLVIETNSKELIIDNIERVLENYDIKCVYDIPNNEKDRDHLLKELIHELTRKVGL